ncbi:mechanosensitive ion channel family protein (plasmid) [Deinococcus radiomollis]|uniref:mechanosensitive ion channel family protein n=1 Tax=Deinococcus radiomollis TaxID=468916 RepID=UPI0038927A1A
MRRSWVALLLGVLVFASIPLFLDDLAHSRATRLGIGLALLVSGLLLLWALARLSERGLNRAGLLYLKPVVRLAQAVGLVTVVLVALSAAGYRLTGILTGTTVLTVVLGLAAQSLLANMMAGLVLTSSRAFRIGDAVTVRSWAFGGTEYGGEVSDLTLTHTVLRGDAGTIKVPNARFLDSTLTLRPHGASAITLTLPPHLSIAALKESLGEDVQVLPISLSSEGWEVTVHHHDGDLSVHRNLEALIGLGDDMATEPVRAEPDLSRMS